MDTDQFDPQREEEEEPEEEEPEEEEPEEEEEEEDYDEDVNEYVDDELTTQGDRGRLKGLRGDISNPHEECREWEVKESKNLKKEELRRTNKRKI